MHRANCSPISKVCKINPTANDDENDNNELIFQVGETTTFDLTESYDPDHNNVNVS